MTCSISTSELSPRERAGAVLGLRERGILPLEPLADRIPQADILKWRMEGAAILLGTLGGLRQIGLPNDPNVGDEAFLGVHLSGASIIRLLRRELTLDSCDEVPLLQHRGRVRHK